MSTQNYVVMTTTEEVQARTLDDDENMTIEGRAVDGSSPGVGINLNPDAANFAAAASVPLVGMLVAPKRIITDPDYLNYCPDLCTYLETLPWCILENETIFAPPEP